MPDIPNADEVREKGILIGEMNAKLLQKIEELTLYTIDQEDQLIKQRSINVNQENLIIELIKRIEILEKN